MKKCICRLMVPAVMLLAVCGEGFADVEVNAANFPDEIFRNYVSSNFNTDSNGTLSDAEIASVTNIDVQNSSISSLKGVEYFTALTHLYCTRNQLTALDLSKNTALTLLYCDYNQLTALDLSKNTALTNLDCQENQLTALDLSKNTALDMLRCHDNKLTALDLSKNTALTQLYCYSNKLTALDVSKNTALTWLDCHNNQLTTLDLSSNTDLNTLICDFTINNEDNIFTFNIVDFMNAYKISKDDLSISFRYYYGSEYGSLNLDSASIADNNVVSFTIPEGKTFSRIEMTLSYPNYVIKNISVYSFVESSSDTTDTIDSNRQT